MLIPEGILFGGKPRSVCSGTPFRFAARSSSPFSIVALAMPWPRTWENRFISSATVISGSRSGSRNSLMMTRSVPIVS